MPNGDTPQIDWQNDPDFKGLPLAEKHKVLLRVDADYKGLPAKEQAKALDTIHYGPPTKSAFSFGGPTVPRPPGGGEEAMLAEGALPGAMGLAAVGGAGGAITHPIRTGLGIAGAHYGSKYGERMFGPLGGIGGALVGGIAGFSGVPMTKGALLKTVLKNVLREAPEEAAGVEAAGAKTASGALTKAAEPPQPPTSLLSRGRTLVVPGAEPDVNNPAHVKMINDYQTMSGKDLRALAAQGDRFAAFVLRHMPRPQ